MKERRQFPRIDTDYVTVEVYTSALHTATPEIEEICTVTNLSESGMRFIADHTFTTGQLLRLTFLLPDSMVIIRTDATIIHVSRNKGNSSNIGVQFRSIGLAERKLIRHFVDKNLQKQQQD